MTIEQADISTQTLRLRLQNCLQTILDIRDSLDSIPFGFSFVPELGSLEQLLAKLDEVPLSEAEVRRIELATDHFLYELKQLVSHSDNSGPDKTGSLQ